MDEQVAKRILFDFEIIALFALFGGLLLYSLLGSFRGQRIRGIGSEFDRLDLILMWFPLLFFLINPIIGFLFPPAPPAEGAPEMAADPTVAQQIGTSFAQLIYFLFIGIITIIILKWLLMRNVTELFGLRRMPFWSVLIVSLAGTFLSFVLCNFLLGKLSTDFLNNTLGELDAQRAVEEMKNADTLPVILITSFLACVVAPVVEEVLFRGYFYGVLKRFTSSIFAAVISSALFAVVHLNLPALAPLWMFAIILTLFYEMTRCLWVPILIHAIFNLANVLMLFWEKMSLQG